MDNPFERPITWERATSVDYPYRAAVDGQMWRLRLGDFPMERLYTLEIDNEDVEGFDDWPEAWVRPPG
jgi:hypothetical protein